MAGDIKSKLIGDLQNTATLTGSQNISSELNYENTVFHRMFYKFIAVFGGYIIIFFIAFGIFGNILSMIIFTRQRKRDSASAIYLGCLAVSDLGNLIVGLGFWEQTSLYYMSFGKVVSVRGWNDTGCKIHTYVWLNCQFMSAWIIIAFSVERAIAVVMPLKAQSILINSRRKFIILSLLTLSLLTWLYIMFDFIKIVGPHPPGHAHRSVCFYEMSKQPKWLLYLHVAHLFIMCQVLPSVTITILNIIIIISIKTKDKIGPDSNNQLKCRSKKEMRCLINLITVSTFYVVSMSPFVAMWCFLIYETLFRQWAGWSLSSLDFLTELAEFAIEITSINYSVNFIIYTVSLDFYQAEVKKIFKCGRHKNGNVIH